MALREHLTYAQWASALTGKDESQISRWQWYST